jgi:hypothetical protein
LVPRSKPMKGKIGSYKELLGRQKQLKALLDAKKDLIRSDMELLRVETKPASDLLGALSHSARKRRLLAIGLGLVARRVFRNLVVMKTPWFVRPIVRYLDENSRLNFKMLIKRFRHRISSILQRNPGKATNEGVEIQKTEQ